MPAPEEQAVSRPEAAAAAAPSEPGSAEEAVVEGVEAAAAGASDAGAADPAETAETAEADPVAAERDQYLELAQRTQADFENYRKRAAKELAHAEARGVGRLAKELLPALDNFERALAAAEAEEADAEHHLTAGIRLVLSELQGALARAGIEAYAPQGERFDPALHEAMAQQPVEGAEPGTVVEVYQQGYRLDGVVLRPARVVVAA